MDVLIIAREDSERTERFRQFVAQKGHGALLAAPGARLPQAKTGWLGAVYFDQGEPNLFEQVRAARERMRYLGIALVVVTLREKPDDQKELRGAGADLLCDPGTPDALIYKEIASRSLAREAAPAFREQLAGPLANAVRQAIHDMADVELTLQSVYGLETPAPLGDIAAVLELTAGQSGLLVMSFSAAAASALAGKILAGVGEEMTPALVHDCMGEITNVIAGQAKALLHGTPFHFTFSPPRVQSGSSLQLPENLSSLVLAFDSEVGGCALQFCSVRA